MAQLCPSCTQTDAVSMLVRGHATMTGGSLGVRRARVCVGVVPYTPTPGHAPMELEWEHDVVLACNVYACMHYDCVVDPTAAWRAQGVRLGHSHASYSGQHSCIASRSMCQGPAKGRTAARNVLSCHTVWQWQGGVGAAHLESHIVQGPPGTARAGFRLYHAHPHSTTRIRNPFTYTSSPVPRD